MDATRKPFAGPLRAQYAPSHWTVARSNCSCNGESRLESVCAEGTRQRQMQSQLPAHPAGWRLAEAYVAAFSGALASACTCGYPNCARIAGFPAGETAAGGSRARRSFAASFRPPITPKPTAARTASVKTTAAAAGRAFEPTSISVSSWTRLSLAPVRLRAVLPDGGLDRGWRSSASSKPTSPLTGAAARGEKPSTPTASLPLTAPARARRDAPRSGGGLHGWPPAGATRAESLRRTCREAAAASTAAQAAAGRRRPELRPAPPCMRS
mmetsp:Transcript_42499/g.121126  ORF Transcript_42499/g.121126 Transcript_42499/m.121126 type:complete len:268 (-) Transcript_42499:31-834(-)